LSFNISHIFLQNFLQSKAAYKDIEKVMQAQSDLVEIVAKLKQVVCVKG
jgi:tRNA-splicing ligase RtcB